MANVGQCVVDVTRGNRDLCFYASLRSRSSNLVGSSFSLNPPLSSIFFRISRESQVVKSYYHALRVWESYVSLTCFMVRKRMGCSLEKHGGKHRSFCGNKVRSAARICILDEHDPISGTSRIVSRGRSSLPIFLRHDRKGRALSRVFYSRACFSKLRKTLQKFVKHSKAEG